MSESNASQPGKGAPMRRTVPVRPASMPARRTFSRNRRTFSMRRNGVHGEDDQVVCCFWSGERGGWRPKLLRKRLRKYPEFGEEMRVSIDPSWDGEMAMTAPPSSVEELSEDLLYVPMEKMAHLVE